MQDFDPPPKVAHMGDQLRVLSQATSGHDKTLLGYSIFAWAWAKCRTLDGAIGPTLTKQNRLACG